MTFREAVTQRDVGLRFAVQIQGIPYLFFDGAIPLGPSGAAWPALAEGELEWSYVEHCLDVEATPIRDPGVELTRSKAEIVSSTMTWTLRDDADDTLLSLFARNRADGQVSNLIDDVDYDTGDTGSVTLTVDSTTGWSAGLAYFGRETIYVNSIGGDSLGGPRDLYNPLGYGDLAYRQNTSRPGAPRVVSSYPRIWHGRYVRVFAFVVGSTGVAYDDAWGGTYMQEIWRGTLEGNPTPARDGLSWELRGTSIEAILHTSVGRETARASLLRSVAPASANVAGTAPAQGLVLLTADTNYVHFVLEAWDSHTDALNNEPPTDVWDHTDGVALTGFPPAVLALSSLTQLWNTIGSTVATDTTNDAQWSIKLGTHVVFTLAASAQWYRLRVLWSLAGSVGPLLGVTETETVVEFGDGTAQGAIVSRAPNAIYVPVNASVVPFYFDPAEGAVGVDAVAPATGYARIGDDDAAEIIQYSAVVPVDEEQLDGCYLLTGVVRGRFGTVARPIAVPLGNESAGETARLTFGVGWESADIVRVLLELAVSTGAGHRGAYDVLPAGTNVPLNPAHFDVDRLEQLASGMAPVERQVSIFLAKPAKLSELVTSWLQPQGRYLHGAMLADGTYRITAGEILPALESAAALTIDETQLDWRDPTGTRPGSTVVVNEIKALYRYDVAKDDWVEGAYVLVVDQDSAEEYGRRSPVEWKLRGAAMTPDRARNFVLTWAQDVFRRYGRPYELLTAKVGREGWFLGPGSVVQLDIAYLPDGTGARGMTQRAVVLQAARRFSGEDPGADLTLVLEPPERLSTYAPSARVASYASGGPTLTLAAAGFGSTDGRPDYEWFEAGYSVWVYEDEADVSTRVKRTITARSGAVITLSSALGGGWTASSAALVTFADYGDATATQRRHVYVAPNSGAFADDPTEAFRYV